MVLEDAEHQSALERVERSTISFAKRLQDGLRGIGESFQDIGGDITGFGKRVAVTATATLLPLGALIKGFINIGAEAAGQITDITKKISEIPPFSFFDNNVQNTKALIALNKHRDSLLRLNRTSERARKIQARLQNQFKFIRFELGRLVFEAAEPYIKKGLELVEFGLKWIKNNEALVKKIASVVLWVGILAAGISVLAISGGFALTIIGKLTTAISLMLSPVGLVLAGFVALGAILINLFPDTLGVTFSNLVHNIKLLFSNLTSGKSTLEQTFGDMRVTLDIFFENLKSNFDTLIEPFNKFIDKWGTIAKWIGIGAAAVGGLVFLFGTWIARNLLINRLFNGMADALGKNRKEFKLLKTAAKGFFSPILFLIRRIPVIIFNFVRLVGTTNLLTAATVALNIGLKALKFALLSTPLGAVILLASLVALAFWYKDKWLPIVEPWVESLEWLAEKGFKFLGALARGVAAGIQLAWADAIDWWTNTAAPWMQSIFDSVVDFKLFDVSLRDVWNSIKVELERVWTAILATFGSVIDRLTGLWASFVSIFDFGVLETIGRWFDTATKFWNDYANTTKKTLKSIRGDVDEAFNNSWFIDGMEKMSRSAEIHMGRASAAFAGGASSMNASMAVIQSGMATNASGIRPAVSAAQNGFANIGFSNPRRAFALIGQNRRPQGIASGGSGNNVSSTINISNNIGNEEFAQELRRVNKKAFDENAKKLFEGLG